VRSHETWRADPHQFEGRMTANGAKIRIAEEKSPVEVRRKSAKMLDFQQIGVSWGLSGTCIGHVGGQTG